MKFIRDVIREFKADNIFKYSASLSYYMVFSIAPVLIIVISLSGFFYGKEAVQGELYVQLNKVFGQITALQIQQTIRNIHLAGNNFVATVISGVVLFVTSTTIFGEVQDSLNKIWGLRMRPGKPWWKLILTRLISFSLIISIGVILLLSILLNSLLTAFGNYLGQYFSELSLLLVSVFNNAIALLASAFLFTLIFKILPDAYIRWKDAALGGLITAVLFTLGKWGIGVYLGKSNMISIYGAASSIVIFMVWVYYSAVTLYLGAEFTKVFAMLYGNRIRPNEYAEWADNPTETYRDFGKDS